MILNSDFIHTNIHIIKFIKIVLKQIHKIFNLHTFEISFIKNLCLNVFDIVIYCLHVKTILKYFQNQVNWKAFQKNKIASQKLPICWHKIPSQMQHVRLLLVDRISALQVLHKNYQFVDWKCWARGKPSTWFPRGELVKTQKIKKSKNYFFWKRNTQRNSPQK